MVTALALLAGVATLACLSALVWVHLRPTGYDPLRDAVSNYGVGPSSAFYRAQTAAMALAAIFTAAALAKAIDPAPTRAIVLLLVFAAARLAIPWFPTDLDRTQRTRTGLIHAGLAGVAFASIAWAAANLTQHVDWPGCRAFGWAVVVTAIATVLAIRTRFPYFGVVERLFYAATIAWLLFVSLNLV